MNKTEDPFETAYYQIQVHFVDGKFSFDSSLDTYVHVANSLIPGNNGLIEYKYNDNKELALTWSPPLVVGT